jgi:hypothetical protein
MTWHLMKISTYPCKTDQLSCAKETPHVIIDSGASCCVTPYIDDFIHQPTPIQNTTLKGISGGLTALGRGTIQLKINKENNETTILVIDNVIYAPDCPIRLIKPQHLNRQSKAKGHENLCFTTEENTATLFHGEIHSHAITTQKQKYQHSATYHTKLIKEHKQHRELNLHNNQATKDANELSLMKQTTQRNQLHT